MSDLFHESVPFEFIGSVFGVMASTPRHTFQVLTKRPARMLEFCEWIKGRGAAASGMFPHDDLEWRMLHCLRALGLRRVQCTIGEHWPIPNVWLGVSVEDQRSAEERIPRLVQTPAAHRFLSIEPLLEDLGTLDLRGIDWVFVGGESGPGARYCAPEWIRSIVKQCHSAKVPVFIKQMGTWWARYLNFEASKGQEPLEWPEDLRVQEMPE
jgi:protein gp37